MNTIIRPRWRIVAANTIGWLGGKLLDLSWRIAGPTEQIIEGFVYRSTPGFEQALHGVTE